MAIAINSTPERTVGGITSRFIAVGNPTPFTFQYSNSGSFVADSYGVLNNRVFAAFTTLPTDIQVTDFVRLNLLSNGNNVFTTITSIDTVNNRVFFNLSIDEGYQVTINRWLQNDYYLQIRIEVEGEQIDLTRVNPFSDGSAFIDPSQYLENELLNNDNFDYVTLQVKDNNASKEFKLYYQEYYRGQLQGAEEETELFYAVNAAKQVQEENGANLVEKIINPSNTAILSLFDKPKVWPGYPFDLSILTQSGTSSNTLETPLGTVTLDQGLFDSVNRIAFDVSNLSGLDGCIESGVATPPLNAFMWVNPVCEVVPTTSPPPPTSPPAPPQEPVSPVICGLNINISGGAGVTQLAFAINYSGFFGMQVNAYNQTDMFNLGILNPDGLTVTHVATTHEDNTNPFIDLNPNIGLSVGGNIESIPFSPVGGQPYTMREITGNALGSGSGAGADADPQYFGRAKENEHSLPFREIEYRAATGDNDTILEQGFGQRNQILWIEVDVGDVVVATGAGSQGTAWEIVKTFCYQT